MKPSALSRASFAALLVAPVWIACAGGAVSPPAGFQRYTSTDRGFQMDVPDGWDAVPDFPIPYGGEKLVGEAFRGPAHGGYRTNVTVVSRSVAGFTAQQVYDNEISQAGSYYPDLRVADRTLLGHAAKLFIFTMGATGDIPKVDVSEAHVIVGEAEWILTLANLAGVRETYEPIFDQMLSSFDQVTP